MARLCAEVDFREKSGDMKMAAGRGWPAMAHRTPVTSATALFPFMQMLVLPSKMMIKLTKLLRHCLKILISLFSIMSVVAFLEDS